MKYTKVPVEIDAIQYLGSNSKEVIEFTNNQAHEESKDGKTYLIIPTLEGNMIANKGSYIIKGVKGEYYPCEEHIFQETYTKSDSIADRLSNENVELDSRLNKLNKFINSSKFNELSKYDQIMLIQQLTYMNGYKDTIFLRLSKSLK